MNLSDTRIGLNYGAPIPKVLKLRWEVEATVASNDKKEIVVGDSDWSLLPLIFYRLPPQDYDSC